MVTEEITFNPNCIRIYRIDKSSSVYLSIQLKFFQIYIVVNNRKPLLLSIKFGKKTIESCIHLNDVCFIKEKISV